MKIEGCVLNLGCGNKTIAWATNHDLMERDGVDVVWDLNVLPWPWEDNSVDFVIARSVFEHLEHNLLVSMNETWRILAPGGIVEIKLPYWNAEVSYDDPTHRYVYGLGIFDEFDPDTKRGRQYGFYSGRKWKILYRPRLNKNKTSFDCQLRVRKPIPCRLSGSAGELAEHIAQLSPDAVRAYEVAAQIPRQMESYQGMGLFFLAKQYDYKGTHILDIGTFKGFSAAILAQAVPKAQILSLNPCEPEVEEAHKWLKAFSNIEIQTIASWDLLETYAGPEFDLIWIDGDHKNVARDILWWRWLSPGGLMVFHDYSGPQSPSPSHVYFVLNACKEISREFDVLIVDDRGVGMAGWYKE